MNNSPPNLGWRKAAFVGAIVGSFLLAGAWGVFVICFVIAAVFEWRRSLHETLPDGLLDPPSMVSPTLATHFKALQLGQLLLRGRIGDGLRFGIIAGIVGGSLGWCATQLCGTSWIKWCGLFTAIGTLVGTMNGHRFKIIPPLGRCVHVTCITIHYGCGVLLWAWIVCWTAGWTLNVKELPVAIGIVCIALWAWCEDDYNFDSLVAALKKENGQAQIVGCILLGMGLGCFAEFWWPTNTGAWCAAAVALYIARFVTRIERGYEVSPYLLTVPVKQWLTTTAWRGAVTGFLWSVLLAPFVAISHWLHVYLLLSLGQWLYHWNFWFRGVHSNPRRLPVIEVVSAGLAASITAAGPAFIVASWWDSSVDFVGWCVAFVVAGVLLNGIHEDRIASTVVSHKRMFIDGVAVATCGIVCAALLGEGTCWAFGTSRTVTWSLIGFAGYFGFIVGRVRGWRIGSRRSTYSAPRFEQVL